MNIRDLKYLIALADYNHFGKAAEACFISQPALSMQIKKLEQILGVQLIERTNKNVLLTAIGKSITDEARDILNRVETLKEMAKQAKDPFSGDLHLGIIGTLAPYLLPYIIPGLSKIFPKVTFYLVEEKTEYLIGKLKTGKLDAAFLALPLEHHELTASPLFEEELLLAIPKSHPFSKRKKMRQEDLAHKELLLLEDGHCLREQVLSLCHNAQGSTNKSFQATSLETLRHMVATNVGMSIMPKLSCKPNDDICYLPFHSPKLTRTIGIIWRPTNAKKILLENLGVEIKKLLAKQKIVKVLNS